MAGGARRACASCCTRCGRCAGPRRIAPIGWPNSSAPIRSAPTMPRTTPSGCCTRRCGAAARSSCAPPMPRRLPAGGALAVDRDGFCRRSRGRARRRASGRDPARGSRALPPGDWDSVIIATGPLTAPALAAAIAAAHRRGRRSPSSMRSRPIVHAETIDRTKPGASRATTRATAPTTSTARSTRRSTSTSSPRCSPRTGRLPRMGRGARPISRAACRSR